MNQTDQPQDNPSVPPPPPKSVGFGPRLAVALGLGALVSAPWGGGCFLGVPGVFLALRSLGPSGSPGNRWCSVAIWTSCIGVLWSLVGLQLLPLQQAHQWRQYEGQAAPELVFEDIDGQSHSLVEDLPRRTLLVFWGTRCPPCLAKIPDLVTLQEQQPEQYFRILSFANEPPERLRGEVEKLGITYPVISLQQSGNRTAPPLNLVRALPTLMVINRRNQIETIHTGALPFQQLEEMATGRPSDQ